MGLFLLPDQASEASPFPCLQSESLCKNNYLREIWVRLLIFKENCLDLSKRSSNFILSNQKSNLVALIISWKKLVLNIEHIWGVFLFRALFMEGNAFFCHLYYFCLLLHEGLYLDDTANMISAFYFSNFKSVFISKISQIIYLLLMPSRECLLDEM